MNTEQWIQTVERFALDVVGTLIPGAVLLSPVLFLWKFDFLDFPPAQTFDWLAWISMSYVLGHVLTSAGNRITRPIAAKLRCRWFGVGESNVGAHEKT
jgi:membrane-bound metal-dependent hydrolase YbcI (DUF457 family)